nr:hypothetical protein [Tanacetum cinerariifolium]
MKFIDPHQPVFLVLILVDKSLWIRISSVSFLTLQIRPVGIQLSKVELLLVAFDTQLKVFHMSLDDDASCEHSKRDIKHKTFFDSQISQLALYKKQQHIFDVLDAKILEVVVAEVRKWNNMMTSVVRLLPSDIRALLDFYT